jgi:hypothetical protein
MLKDFVRRAVRSLSVGTEAKPWFSVAGAALFGIALVCVHASHELWRDEMHCWSLARNAQGFWDLLTGVRRYDGHPFLWYYVLYLVSRLSRSVVMLHATTIILASLSAYLWLRDAPLPRMLRLPLLATYLFFYEYGVLSRSYALGLLCLFLFCWIYRRELLRVPLLSLLLTLLALTSAYGAMIAVALGLTLFLQAFADLYHARREGRSIGQLALSTVGGIIVLGLGLGGSWITSIPPSNGFFAPAGILGPAPIWPNLAISYWLAYFPRCNPNNGSWMVTAAMGDEWSMLAPALPWLGIAWLVLCLVALRKAPLVAIGYAAGIAIMAGFQHRVYAGYIRHFGHYFILLIGCIWLHQKQRPEARQGRLLGVLLATSLAVQIATCVAAVKTETNLPFSGALEAAQFLRSQGFAEAPLVGSFDHMASTVAGYLDRPFRSTETYEKVTSVVFHNHRWAMGMPLQIVFNVALLEAKNAGRPAVLLLNRDIGEYARPDARIDRLYVTAPAIVADERFWIFRVSPVSP